MIGSAVFYAGLAAVFLGLLAVLRPIRSLRLTRARGASLAAAGLIDENKGPAKLLANGEISQAYTVRGVKVSAGARTKIEAAGGKVE